MPTHSAPRPIRAFIKQALLSIPSYFDELKEIRRPYEFYQWMYFKLPYLFPLAKFPVYVGIEVTNLCNFSCIHCWRSVMTRPIGSIEPDLFEKIVKELILHTPITIKLGGAGEIALHPQLRQLMSLLKPHNFRTIAYTNGSLLRMFPHNEILKWNINTLIVSVDGTDRESYERIRVGGKYDVLRNDLTQFYNLRNRYGLRWPVIEIRHVIMPYETSAQLQQFRNNWLPIANRVKFNFLQGVKGREEVPVLFRPKCRAIRRELSITMEGNSPLCQHGYRGEYLGNLYSTSIQELWRHSRIECVREYHQRRNLDQVPICKYCPP